MSPDSWCRPRPRSPRSASGSWRTWRPDLDHVTVLSHPDNPLARRALAHARAAASRQGVELRSVEARTLADAERAFTGVKPTGRAGLLVLPDALFAIEQRRIVAFAAQHRIPTLYSAGSFVEAGGLMALSSNAGEVIHRAATVVARVLAGARPAALPMETLAPLVLTVNAEAARAISLAMPRSLLARADASFGPRHAPGRWKLPHDVRKCQPRPSGPALLLRSSAVLVATCPACGHTNQPTDRSPGNTGRP